MIMDIKMQRVIVILGVLLFPKALSALRCYECLGEGCTETPVDCPASHQCGAQVIRTSQCGTNSIDVNSKGCIPSAGCDVSGSMDFGFIKSLAINKCCSTNLCNVQYPTLPDSSPNGKKCYTCKGNDCSNSNDCSNILPCSGDEDQCISASEEQGGNKVTLKGCVSKNMCVPSKSGTIAHAIAGIKAVHISCCDGDLCNSATSTAVGLLLLLAAPVVSVALFN